MHSPKKSRLSSNVKIKGQRSKPPGQKNERCGILLDSGPRGAILGALRAMYVCNAVASSTSSRPVGKSAHVAQFNNVHMQFTITAVIRKQFHEYRMTTCKLAKKPRLISSYRHLGKPKK